MVTTQQALDGFATFVSNDVISAMPNGLQKFLAYMVLGASRNNPWAMLKPYEGMLKSLGILSKDDSYVDVEILRNSLQEAFNNMPNLSFMGFNFTIDDANKLIQRIGG